jgi:hypothetical protein
MAAATAERAIPQPEQEKEFDADAEENEEDSFLGEEPLLGELNEKEFAVPNRADEEV